MGASQTLDEGIVAVLTGKSLKSAEIARILGIDHSLSVRSKRA